VGAQLIRSADSIGANMAEAYGRHGGDQVRFLYIARGSVHETEHWIDVARARGLLEGALPCRVRKVGRMLNGLINSHRTR
jgi:four helix bundle protein